MKWLYKAINWNVHELFMCSYLFLPKDTKYKSKEQSVNLCLNILFHNRELSASLLFLNADLRGRLKHFIMNNL